VLNAKGGEIKAKANGSANHLRLLKIEELGICFCQNTFIAKFGLLWGRIFYYGKRGSFLHLINLTLGISLYLPKQMCLI
jgi:hypothetical protein